MRKKIVITMLLSCLYLGAKDFSYKGIVYSILDENEKTVQTKEGFVETDPEDSSKEVHVPGNSVSGFIILPEIVIDETGQEYTLTKIGQNSFCNNSSLLAIWLPQSVDIIDNYAFYGCSNMLRIDLPDEMNTIGDYAFFSCLSMGDIVIPNGLYIIKEGTFAGCGFEHVTLPQSLMAISEYAFMACMSLTEIHIPDDVFIMGTACFLGCVNLTTVHLPADLMFADSMMFYQCTKIASIYYPTNSPASATKNTFDDSVYSNAILYIPNGSKSAMDGATPWKYFTNKVEYDFAAIDNILQDIHEAPIEYYDLNGRRILSPDPGQILIRRSGSNSSKIIF
ncbi:MAG: leucine-rich repeat domain-containing protein [Muribaculaceae bacterium]|nr:leucine-rich repeat domain-containing protein [Muribaculaceae bacterium]